MMPLRESCACGLSRSASSNSTTLKEPQAILLMNGTILLRIKSIPVSRLALTSNTSASRISISATSILAMVVFPIPGGPLNSRCGMLFSVTHVSTCLRCAASRHTYPSIFLGRYFSTHSSFIVSAFVSS